MVKNKKGSRRERECVKRLYDHGFAVLRAPSSGAATTRELPDVLAGNGEVVYAIEAKASNGDPIYLSAEEVEALVYFAERFGAIPAVGARFDYEDWYFLSPFATHCTASGKSYRVKKDLALAAGVPMAALADGPEVLYGG